MPADTHYRIVIKKAGCKKILAGHRFIIGIGEIMHPDKGIRIHLYGLSSLNSEMYFSTILVPAPCWPHPSI